MEISGTFFDMSRERHEVFVDQPGGLIVLVGFGFQPNATASAWRGAEIDQQRFLTRFRFRESGVCIFQPIYFHCSAPDARA